MGLQIHPRGRSSYARLSVRPVPPPSPKPLTTEHAKCLRGELPGTHPTFPEGSKAGLIVETNESGPLGLDAPVAEYDEADDAAVEKYTREFVVTAWHHVS